MFIKVRIQPSSKIEKIQKKSDDHFILKVKEPPERNLANNRICEIIALNFNIKRSAVRIVSGHHSPSKILSVNI
jgi:uncharacterized protein YggU (UPF0235/DUF167 family)